MNYTRREFLTLASLAPLALWPRRSTVFLPEGLQSLRGDVGFYTERGGTIGYYVTSDFLIVVDSQFPDTAEHFVQQIQSKNSRNIDILFNTHHHGDHTAGNFFLGPMSDEIVAHKDAVRLQRKRYSTGENADKQVYADTTFDEPFTVDTGSEQINARHFGPGHTGGDAIIHFEKANVVHLGDLVFNNVYPVIDVDTGEASIPGWITVLEKAVKTYPSDALFIFGHSIDDHDVTGSTAELLRMRDYLTALEEHVRKQKRAGKSVGEIVNAGFVPSFGHLKERWKGAFRHNIEATFKSIDE